eukprot:gnl/TRDRNA2_/TRDRNA2_157602_c0_seq2.p1 gnl/TRDRNA2_/TRDRNA2_157602_c0~~gnl/TRDRNA2_/TRDRNA2_157602_c0_seq2.p1  ORF type:complete len:199 (+),score=15.01 gnl/TRDRNA2_/TRDRNA2_157602_c0_seq2:619-1215(+)
MYGTASRVLQEAGYLHYEISSYAQPGHHSRHNSAYWTLQPYLAVGMGASSLIMDQRITRPRAYQTYKAYVDLLKQRANDILRAAPSDIHSHAYVDRLYESIKGVSVEPAMTTEDFLQEVLMLRLRTSGGISLSFLSQAFSSRVAEAVETTLTGYANEGFVSVQKDERDTVFRLTDPKGFLCSNVVISDVFVAIDEETQ